MSQEHPKPATKAGFHNAKIDASHTVAETRFLRLEQLDYTSPFGRQKKWDVVRRVRQAPAPAQAPAPSTTAASAKKPDDGVIVEHVQEEIIGDGLAPLMSHLGLGKNAVAAASSSANTESTADGVFIFAILNSKKNPLPHGPETIVVKQFRPPCNSIVVELPAGLIDKGESPGTAAVRELWEETGYKGVLLGISQPCVTSAGLSSETLCMVVVRVDLDLPENQNVPTIMANEKDEEYLETERVPLRQLLVRLDELSENGCSVFTGLYGLAFGLSLAWTPGSL
eukprot:CAMPEP_0184699316 /NCGR_PEP_ID=MMETSP0313-20130426/5632_1 /TAXON_ID=2792 /ORGANISM="Porphyridium aerugineum, Strain SAG 1380-2" /LENGTH=281 /DNA_ID=CAMNT_0027158389 /DNA_START=409 /DNA_END=1254 /DNA_ORIENTATION=+